MVTVGSGDVVEGVGYQRVRDKETGVVMGEDGRNIRSSTSRKF